MAQNNAREFISDYWLIVLIAVTGMVVIVFTVYGWSIASAVVSCSLLVFIGIKDLRSKHRENVEDEEKKLSEERMKRIEGEINKSSSLQEKQDIIKEFLKEGVIRDEDILDNLSQQPFIILYHFNRRPLESFKKYFPSGKRAIKTVLEQLGFVPVGSYTGSYFFHIISANDLPKDLQKIPTLEAYLRKKVRSLWEGMWRKMELENPSLYKKYELEKNKRKNVIYFLGKIFPSNLSVGYLNFSSFDPKFLSYYSKFINIKTVRINKQKLSEFIALASISFFIKKIYAQDQRIILSHENKIKTDLDITSLSQYMTVPEERWIEVLNPIFNNEEKAKNYAEKIYSSTQKYCPIIDEFV